MELTYLFQRSLFDNRIPTVKTPILSTFITGGDLTLDWMNEWMNAWMDSNGLELYVKRK